MTGSHLADYLLTVPDVEVHGLKRVRSRTENIDHLWGRVAFHDVDLTDAIAVQDLFEENNFDYVFHLAAQSDPGYSFKNPTETLRTNIFGTLNVLQNFCPYGRSKLLVCSSSEVYGRQDGVMTEKTSLNPASPYGVSKAGADLLSQVYKNAYTPPIYITRAFSHTGPRRGPMFAESSFAKQIAEIEVGKRIVMKHGNLSSIRTYMDVRDLVRAYWNLLYGGYPPDVYNIGGDETISIRGVLEILLSLSTDSHIDCVADNGRLRPLDVTKQVPDSSKFRDMTGWRPTIPLKQTLTDLLNYWRERV